MKTMLTGFLVAAAVIVALGNGNRCRNKADIELYDKKNSSIFYCWPLPECHDGQEPSVKQGSSHPQGKDIGCSYCLKGFFSNNGTNKRCRKCTPCDNKEELLSCMPSRDRQCSNSCISRAFYFNATDEQCHPCTECCKANDEDIEPQCISMTVGTVIGEKGEKHCKASSKSSKQCDELPKKNLSTASCSNSSLPSNTSELVESECTCTCSHSLDGLHIGLVCFLVLVTALSVVLGWLAFRRRRRTGDHLSLSERFRCLFSCLPGSSSYAGHRCAELMERAPCITCQEKLQFIPEGVKINDLPYDVEEKLIKNLDAKMPCTKNWWDVGRKTGIAVSDLNSVKREDDREDGSPTKVLIRILCTQENVLSLRAFVEIIHNLGRHDICNAICEFYQSESSTA